MPSTCLKLAVLPSDLCSRARTGSSCALLLTAFTDEIVFKHCLLLNRSTEEFVFFFPPGKQGRIRELDTNLPLPASRLLTLYRWKH